MQETFKEKAWRIAKELTQFKFAVSFDTANSGDDKHMDFKVKVEGWIPFGVAAGIVFGAIYALANQ